MGSLGTHIIQNVKRHCFNVFRSKTFENMVFSKVDMCGWGSWEQVLGKVKRPCFGVFSSKTFENMVFSMVDMAKKMLFVCAWAISSQHFVSGLRIRHGLRILNIPFPSNDSEDCGLGLETRPFEQTSVPYIESSGKNYSLLNRKGPELQKWRFGSDGIRLPLGLGIMWPS